MKLNGGLCHGNSYWSMVRLNEAATVFNSSWFIGCTKTAEGDVIR
jgi:hypothetical protein